MKQLKSHMDRPWGSWAVLEDYGPEVKVKHLIVDPGKFLSDQKHEFRSEHWFVATGQATVKLDGIVEVIEQFGHLHIPVGSWHQLFNNGNDPLVIVEIQYGEQCVESDIIRTPETDYE